MAKGAGGNVSHPLEIKDLRIFQTRERFLVKVRDILGTLSACSVFITASVSRTREQTNPIHLSLQGLRDTQTSCAEVVSPERTRVRVFI